MSKPKVDPKKEAKCPFKDSEYCDGNNVNCYSKNYGDCPEFGRCSREYSDDYKGRAPLLDKILGSHKIRRESVHKERF